MKVKEFLKEYYGTFSHRQKVKQVINMMKEVFNPMLQERKQNMVNNRDINMQPMLKRFGVGYYFAV